MNAQDSCANIYRLMQPIMSKYTKVANGQYSSSGVTAPQAEILLLLREKGPLSIGEISEALGVVVSNVSGICKRLEKMDLVARVRQEDDQRMVKVQLLESALPNVEEIRKDKQALYDKISDQIPQDDIEMILQGLEKFNNLLGIFLSEP